MATITKFIQLIQDFLKYEVGSLKSPYEINTITI